MTVLYTNYFLFFSLLLFLKSIHDCLSIIHTDKQDYIFLLPNLLMPHREENVETGHHRLLSILLMLKFKRRVLYLLQHISLEILIICLIFLSFRKTLSDLIPAHAILLASQLAIFSVSIWGVYHALYEHGHNLICLESHFHFAELKFILHIWDLLHLVIYSV
jgi:hypothetical protein